jgi:hypothetical protein
MKWTPKIERAIIQAIEANPDREIVLPDSAYWEGINAPWIYRDGLPEPLPRVLYEQIIGVLPTGAGLSPRPGTHPRNINPHLFVVTPSRRARAACPNGHLYTEDDWFENVGHRCQTCRVMRLTGRTSPIEINRAKRVCPEGHDLILRPNGRRRCLECPRRQQAEYIQRKRAS